MAELNNVLFVRNCEKQEDCKGTNAMDLDREDNAIIINTYNEMTKVSHSDIAKKIAASTSINATNKTKIQNDTELGEDNKSDHESQDDESHDFDIVDDIPVWEIGCDCRVTFKEDKIDYEATIIDIYHDYTCLVEFVGYGNQQVEKLEKLLPSWGLEAQQKQIKDSETYYANLEGNDINDFESISNNAKGDSHRLRNTTKRNKDVFGSGLLPPQPPLPPMLANGGPMEDPEQNDALSAMLMSWYMSGYYTGLYHGQLKGNKK